jgi:alkanesulfonate monooxygenase SsuD/methylene tetrahydromethanopterin reductase-like flavin-dependent oxidoreductase (luciferase family)
MMDRFWEALDLISKAMTTHDGPFNWEGEYFHHRQINIWPRPHQQPMPNVWISAGSPASAIVPAERGYTVATVLSLPNAKRLFHAYRKRTAELGRPAPALDRFGYLALVGVGHTKEEGFAKLHKIRGYLRSTGIVAQQFQNPPGYAPLAANAQGLATTVKGRVSGEHLRVITRDGRHIDQAVAPHEDLIDGGVAFAGTPDEVVEQIRRFNDDVGGLGHLLIMGHGGDLTHEETVENLTLFASEVLPRLRDIKASQGAEFDELETIRERARQSGVAA